MIKLGKWLLVVVVVLAGLIYWLRTQDEPELFVAPAVVDKPPVEGKPDWNLPVRYLPQGWSQEERDKLSYTSFGSRILPYDWFISLELAGSEELLASDASLAHLGFITNTPGPFNPDGLPVGVTRDGLGADAWVGLTCAACHTGQLVIAGQRLRIDGGQALINYTAFEESICASLKAALTDSQKFSRFMTRLRHLPSAPQSLADEQKLRASMQQQVDILEQRFATNATRVPYGHGRLDAFGQIFNAISVEVLNQPGNGHTPNAPSSFPVLWDASHLDLVQWNASAPNKEPGPLFQNTITAMAVYGSVTVKPGEKTYASRIRINNLGYVQNQFYKLIAPQWPADLAGAIDSQKAAAGQKIYVRECQQCHQLVDSADKQRRLKAVLTPASEIGTDPLMVENFNHRHVNSGILEGSKTMVLAGSKIAAQTSPMDLVMHVSVGALLDQPWTTFKTMVREFHGNDAAPAQTEYMNYKARPINGIWASAPYLHNGSVPTVYDLLLPVVQRPQIFNVGNIQMDVIKLGYLTDATESTSEFDTSQPGNSNAGHAYGTQLSEAERWQLLEYIKTL